MPVDRQQVAAVALASLLLLSLGAGAVDMERKTETSETTYDAVVVFRNDDVQDGYRFETMRAVDRVFVEENVPVSLGVIAGGLDADGRTCSYLRDLVDDHGDQFEIAAHGYTHEAETEFGGASEFGGHDRDVQADKLERMTDRIATCTGERPTTFVAPFDTYDGTTIELLAERGYETASGGGQTRTLLAERTEPTVGGAFQTGNVTHVPRSQAFVADWETREFHDLETLEAAFEATAENGSVYVQMIHYQTFAEPDDRERLRSFIRTIEDYGDVRFATLGELGELVRDGDIRYDETDDRWHVTETIEGDLELEVGFDDGVRIGVEVGVPAAQEAQSGVVS